MSKVTEAMPSPMDRRRLKDRIVENVSKAVKQVRKSAWFHMIFGVCFDFADE